jgi:hypothetical protein
MKKFIYFQSTDGGMDTFSANGEDDFQSLYGWMTESCIEGFKDESDPPVSLRTFRGAISAPLAKGEKQRARGRKIKIQFYVRLERLKTGLRIKHQADDSDMLKWMVTAEIGDVYYHRLGCLVRVKDTSPVRYGDLSRRNRIIAAVAREFLITADEAEALIMTEFWNLK